MKNRWVRQVGMVGFLKMNDLHRQVIVFKFSYPVLPAMGRTYRSGAASNAALQPGEQK
jgi:hypothetical protein